MKTAAVGTAHVAGIDGDGVGPFSVSSALERRRGGERECRPSAEQSRTRTLPRVRAAFQLAMDGRRHGRVRHDADNQERGKDHVLLVPKCDDRIDAGGAARRNVTGQHRRRDQHERDDRESDGVRGVRRRTACWPSRASATPPRSGRGCLLRRSARAPGAAPSAGCASARRRAPCARRCRAHPAPRGATSRRRRRRSPGSARTARRIPASAWRSAAAPSRPTSVRASSARRRR
jgi:hypothetical protein